MALAKIDSLSPSDNNVEPSWKKKQGSIVTKSSATTNPKYGCAPEKRPLDSYINNGIINLNKPPGPTSHEVVAWIKRIFGLSKAGHSGTLDPAVTGVLPVALGTATKVLQGLLGSDKEYITIITLHHSVSKTDLVNILQQFQGLIYQKPPVRSSVKRRLRTRRIYENELLEFEDKLALLRVSCQAGTYIRKLATDIGDALGVGAHMKELRRIRTGAFSEKNHHYSLHDVKDAYYFYVEDRDETDLREVIRPLEETFAYSSKIYIRDSAVDAICHGAKLTVPGVVKLSSNIKPKQSAVLLTLKGEAVAYGVTNMSTKQILNKQHGIVFTPNRVFMPPGIYPVHEK